MIYLHDLMHHMQYGRQTLAFLSIEKEKKRAKTLAALEDSVNRSKCAQGGVCRTLHLQSELRNLKALASCQGPRYPACRVRTTRVTQLASEEECAQRDRGKTRPSAQR